MKYPSNKWESISLDATFCHTLSDHEESAMHKNTEYRAVNKQLQSEIDYKVIGRHMQATRQRNGMTQAIVAEKMKLGVKYYAALEAGTENISLSRLIQFICIMQSSSETLLAGCHPDYPPKHICSENVCHERILLNKLLDQCSDDLIKTLYVIAQGLLNQST